MQAVTPSYRGCVICPSTAANPTRRVFLCRELLQDSKGESRRTDHLSVVLYCTIESRVGED